MPIRKAKDAAGENTTQFINPDKDPVMFNLNVALFNIAEGIEDVISRLDSIETRIKRIERG